MGCLGSPVKKGIFIELDLLRTQN